MDDRTYGETRNCRGCRYWSEMIAEVKFGHVVSMCISINGPLSGKWHHVDGTRIKRIGKESPNPNWQYTLEKLDDSRAVADGNEDDGMSNKPDLLEKISDCLIESSLPVGGIEKVYNAQRKLLLECGREIKRLRDENRELRISNRDVYLQANVRLDECRSDLEELRAHCERVTGTSPVNIGENKNVLRHVKIKSGALVVMDHQVWTWPNLPNAKPDLIFRVVDRYQIDGTKRSKCIRDGFGTIKDYGNGALWVNDNDLEPIDKD